MLRKLNQNQQVLCLSKNQDYLSLSYLRDWQLPSLEYQASLIKHQDQLLDEIHKIKGFEDVTIDDVLKGTTGLPKDTMFNILSNSDASFATDARTEEQNRMPTDYLVNSSSNFKSEAETRYNSEGFVKSDTENNEYMPKNCTIRT